MSLQELLVPLHDRRGAVVAYALVDPDDLEWASAMRWHMHSKGYAATTLGAGGKTLMQRLIMERRLGRSLEKGEQVHHDNESKLDNRRGNLVLTTWGDHHRDFHSGRGRGVCRHFQSGRWMAYLDRAGHRRRYLGLHDTEDEALEAVARAREEMLNATA